MNLPFKQFLTRLYKSCTSFSFYKEIYQEPFAKSLKYFLSFILILSIISIIPTVKSSYQEANRLQQWLIKSELKIEQGELIARPNTEPFEITANQLTFMIDPNTNSPDLTPYQRAYIISRTGIIAKNLDTPGTKKIDFNKEQNWKISAKIINQYKTIVMLIVPFFLVLVRFIFIVLQKIIQIIIFTALSFLNCKILNIPFSFENLLNICTYATIPPFLFYIGFSFLNIKNSYFSALHFIMYALFIIGALNACKPEEPAKEKELPLP